MSKVIKTVFLLVGCLLFAWAVRAVDMGTVADLLIRLGYGFLLVLLIYCVVTWLDTVAWKYTFKPEDSLRFSLWQLWRVRQIGEAYNTITPFGTLGGEPVKAQLLKDHHGLSLKQGLASQVVARTTFMTALIFFFVPGIILILKSDLVSGEFKMASLTGMAVFSLMIFLFFLFQLTGTLSVLTGWVSRFPFGEKAGPLLGKLEQLDQLMSGYYKAHAGMAVKSIGYAFTGWIVGIGELYVVLVLLGYDPSFADLWMIEALTQLVRVGSFFIPLSIGAQESGFVLIFAGMGMPADLGLTVSFVRRIKELIWVGMGLVMGWALAFKPSKIQPEASEG